ncbi:hypothetical protein J0X19_10005 [Hymenobacter sp. BT186]|uniref:Uncharacterized protein n=1 Tax=Hymenobacter telluris TaxID=2816474 RepID=A0A939EW44_9BACT|nr:DUF6526 family protein [Hymenobacter telluris]MBO0358276.1 hypothetical protein [Hymenobacter telluris]MBW3374302.1 hypothetical protein [Hymenobacter norwichensis]
MATQPTKNKPMVYVWHHFILLPMLLILALYGIRRYAAVFGDDSEDSRLWFTVMALAVASFGVLLMLRQHYALTLQDRIIRLEVRQQYFEATGQSFRPLESQLQLSQILALRFAGDAELPALVQAAIREKLSSKEIQARIEDFHFDHMRV